MNCPRCSQEAIPGTLQCPGCGLSLRTLDAHFGGKTVLLERLIDAAHCLKLREKETVEARLHEFENQFPQLYASVYIGSLPEWTNVSEFGFWFLNRGTISTPYTKRSNYHTILLVLDPDQFEAGITLGYAAEQILGQKSVTRSLAKGRLPWRSGEFSLGIASYLHQLSKELRRACRKIPGAHRALADRLDTLPPPDLSPCPVSAPGSTRSEILEPSFPSHTLAETNRAHGSSFGSLSGRSNSDNQLELAGGVSFGPRVTTPAF